MLRQSKPTPAQLRALEAIRDGDVRWAAHMGWFQQGGYRCPRGVRTDTVERVVDAGWAKKIPVDPGRSHSDVVLTDAGREALR